MTKTNVTFRATEPPEWSVTPWELCKAIIIDFPVYHSRCIWERYFVSRTRGMKVTTIIKTQFCCEKKCDKVECKTKTEEIVTEEPFIREMKEKSATAITGGTVVGGPGREYPTCIENPPRF
ncbi:MAG: hypothetical protein AB1765_13555 [Candidatus Hydrogenedentota bacterium]